MIDAVSVVDQMIEEALRPLETTQPVLGGARQVPFDGEVVGRFIRYCVLWDVRAAITGEAIDPDEKIKHFNSVVGCSR